MSFDNFKEIETLFTSSTKFALKLCQKRNKLIIFVTCCIIIHIAYFIYIKFTFN